MYQIAESKLNYRELSETVSCGSVAAALLTDKGNVYTGVNIDAACGVGFCAEHAAIASMVTAGESQIQMLVAVGDRNCGVLPPCGRCREFMMQINGNNRNAKIWVSQTVCVPLQDLLPHYWK